MCRNKGTGVFYLWDGDVKDVNGRWPFWLKSPVSDLKRSRG